MWLTLREIQIELLIGLDLLVFQNTVLSMVILGWTIVFHIGYLDVKLPDVQKSFDSKTCVEDHRGWLFVGVVVEIAKLPRFAATASCL